MGVSQPTVKQIESNFNDIRMSSLKRYVESLGLNLIVQVGSSENKSLTIITDEGNKMSDNNDFFKKIEDKKNEEEKIEVEKKIEIEKKMSIDKEKLQCFSFETKKLVKEIKEVIADRLSVYVHDITVHGDYFKDLVPEIQISLGNTSIVFTPTGPRFGSFLGVGVIEITSNSKFFMNETSISHSLILKKNKNEEFIWVHHKFDRITKAWSQEEFNMNAFFKLLEKVFLADH